MEKYAKDVKIGEKFQPWISERSMKRRKITYTATDLPKKQTGAFSHYVSIPCIDSKGKPYNVFIFCEESVTIVD